MKAAMVGCGVFGKKRADALVGCQLVACADVVLEKAQAVALQHPGCDSYQDWQMMLARHPEIQFIIVSTIHRDLTEVALGAIMAGKHVLVEKPVGPIPSDITRLIHAAKEKKVLVKVGFNHRYHPAIQKAHVMCRAGELGNLMFVRGRYGHGGRMGYEQEWRAKPELSGGGELIDQGSHLIDLARWFLGDFSEVDGYAHTYFWKMPVDDNAFLILKTKQEQVAFLHVSCTEWKNLFSLEIVGEKGKLQIDGLGGNYGVESLTFYKMPPQMGPPEIITWEFPRPDNSWGLEMADFLENVRLNRSPSPNLHDAHAVSVIVDKVYRDCGYR